MNLAFDFEKYHVALNNVSPINSQGKITKIVGLIAEAIGPVAMIGSLCDIYPSDGLPKITAEVVGFRENRILLMPLGELHGIGPGNKVISKHRQASIDVGESLLGRVIDGLGNPIDGKGPLICDMSYPIYSDPVNPMKRKRIREPLGTGIKALDGLFTVGRGQRMGIFAGSGVGKSVLLGMIAKNSTADVNVIALIGERGRELNEFLERDLGEEGLKRSVVVVATSENLPLIRMRGAFIASSIAEYFRDQGKHVILMMDSITRFAMAQREVGLAVGEPPTSKGYTPSVFSLLPKLLERAGTCHESGTITGLYTVLVEGDDMNDPVADAVRAIIDGHVVLSRDLAMHGHYPAIDILNSVSRVMTDIIDKDHMTWANKLKSMMATYRKAEDLINIGAYVKGNNTRIDEAVSMIDSINLFLQQDIEQSVPIEESIIKLGELFNKTKEYEKVPV